MGAPAITTTWTYSRNNSFPTTGVKQTDYQQNLRGFKNILKTLGCTVVGSSNGVTAGLDGVDRWATNGDIIWAANGIAHSWIVLRMPGFAMANGFEILISTGSATSGVDYGKILVRVTHDLDFSGGSVTTDPTSANSQLLHASDWLGNFATASTAVQGLVSDDGEAIRLVWYISNVPVAWLWMEAPINRPAAWTTTAPVVVGFKTSTAGNVDQLTSSVLTTSGNVVTRVNGTNRNASLVSMRPPSAVAGTFYVDSSMTPDGLTGDFAAAAFMMATSAVFFAFLGNTRDVWHVQAGTLVEGDHTLDGATRVLMVMGQLLVPWENVAQLATPTNQAGTARVFGEVLVESAEPGPSGPPGAAWNTGFDPGG